MSVKISNLTKIFGSQKALDNVTLEVNMGEVVGLLGPNGAGKTTMMRIITCFIPPTSGNISVCGMDVLEQSLEVRKKLDTSLKTIRFTLKCILLNTSNILQVFIISKPVLIKESKK